MGGLPECLDEDESEQFFLIDESPGVYEGDYTFNFRPPDDGEGDFVNLKPIYILPE